MRKSREGKEKIGRERTKNQVKWTSTLRAMKTLALLRLPSANKPLRDTCRIPRIFPQ